MLIENLIQVQGPIFQAVQESNIFADNKIFVDSIPKKDPEVILKEFESEKDKHQFNLKAFIEENFSLPSEPESPQITSVDAGEYIDLMWDVLTKDFSEKNNFSTLLPLPEKHVVPGGRFRESYYWDSYFIAEGLVASDRLDLASSLIKNLAFQIDHFGYIPNGNRFYYLTRSQQPYFSLLVDLLHREGQEELSLSFYPQLLREYKFWMNGEDILSKERPFDFRVVFHGNKYILNRYFDELNHPREEARKADLETFSKATSQTKENLYRNIRATCESGWDFTSRFLDNPDDISTLNTTAYLPIDLNTLLYHHEMLLAKFSDILDKKTETKEYFLRADRRKSAINELFFDEDQGFYFDYQFEKGKRSKVYSLAGVFPLFFEICSQERANKIAEVLEKQFLRAGGLATTLNQTNCQWDGDIGWAPLQFIAYWGLKNYGFDQLALEVAKRFSGLCLQQFGKSHAFFEKYDLSEDKLSASIGEYSCQEGFGWTNAVVKIFLEEIRKSN